MNLKRYRERLARDLDRWIANGWVPASSRELILADVPAEATGRTALWLGMIGATLAGLAIIAAIADNWAVIPRAGKLILLLVLLWGALIGAMRAGPTRPNFVNGLTLIASLVFAASIGLLGQSLNIPGDPDNALILAAIGAGVLALAAESVAAGVVYLAFVALMYWADTLFSFWGEFSPGDNLHFALFLAGGGVLALLLPSRLLAHGTLILLGALVLNNAWRFVPGIGDHAHAYAAAGAWASAATVGYIGVLRGVSGAGILLGWSVWHGLAAFGLAGFEDRAALLHRVLWIAASIGVIAATARLRQPWALAAAVISLIAACWAILLDLGLELGAAAFVFGVVALLVLGIAWLLRRKPKES